MLKSVTSIMKTASVFQLFPSLENICHWISIKNVFDSNSFCISYEMIITFIQETHH